MSLFKYCVEICSYHTLSVKGKLSFLYRATLTEIRHIKINHIWTQINYSSPHEAHLKMNQRIFFLFFAVKSYNFVFSFRKSQKLLIEKLHQKPTFQNIQQLFIQFQWRIMQPPYTGLCPFRATCPGGGEQFDLKKKKKKKPRPFAISPFLYARRVVLWYGVCRPSVRYQILVRITPPLLFNEISSYLHGWMILMCSCA